MGMTMQVWKRLAWTILGIALWRLGLSFPMPGIDMAAGNGATVDGSYISLNSLEIGGRALFAALTMLEFLRLLSPRVEELPHLGAEGRRRLLRRIGLVALVLTAVLAFGTARKMEGMAFQPSGLSVVAAPGPAFRALFTLSACAGLAAFLLIAKLISTRGIANGFVVLFFASGAYELWLDLTAVPWAYIPTHLIGEVLALTAALTIAVVILERARRRFPVEFLPGAAGGGRESATAPAHVELRVNSAGIYPLILAYGLLWLPSSMASFFPAFRDASKALGPQGDLLFITVAALLGLLFAVLGILGNSSPMDLADTLKRRGAFLLGVKPGRATALRLDRSMLLLSAASYLGLTLLSISTSIGAARLELRTGFSSTFLLTIATACWIADRVRHELGMRSAGPFEEVATCGTLFEASTCAALLRTNGIEPRISGEEVAAYSPALLTGAALGGLAVSVRSVDAARARELLGQDRLGEFLGAESGDRTFWQRPGAAEPEPEESTAPAGHPEPLFRVAVTWAVALACAGTLVTLVLPVPRAFVSGASSIQMFVAGVAWHIGAVWALAWHIRERERRHLKYGPMLVASALGTSAHFTALAFEAMDRQTHGLAFLAGPAGVVAIQWACALLGHGSRAPSRRARRFLVAVASTPALMVLVWLASMSLSSGAPSSFFVALHVFACSRLAIFDRLAKWPVLFLRSFYGSKGRDVFRAVVAPATEHHGVVVALGNDGAERYELQRSLNLLARPIVEWHRGAAWQDSVRQLLLHAGVVIVDASGRTAGVRWELEQIAALVDPRQVLVIKREDAPCDLEFDPRWTVITVAPGPEGEAQARPRLREAFRDALDVVSAPSARLAA